MRFTQSGPPMRPFSSRWRVSVRNAVSRPSRGFGFGESFRGRCFDDERLSDVPSDRFLRSTRRGTDGVAAQRSESGGAASHGPRPVVEAAPWQSASRPERPALAPDGSRVVDRSDGRATGAGPGTRTFWGDSGVRGTRLRLPPCVFVDRSLETRSSASAVPAGGSEAPRLRRSQNQVYNRSTRRNRSGDGVRAPSGDSRPPETASESKPTDAISNRRCGDFGGWPSTRSHRSSTESD
jgi:hypothetical protein